MFVTSSSNESHALKSARPFQPDATLKMLFRSETSAYQFKIKSFILLRQILSQKTKFFENLNLYLQLPVCNNQ